MEQKLKQLFLIIGLLLCAGTLSAQGQTFPAAPLNGSGAPSFGCGPGVLYTDNLTGNVYSCAGGTFIGPLPTYCKNFESVRCVDATNTQAWAGSDFGAWLVAADASLGATCGEIWVAAAGTTITTAPTINTCHVVRIIQPGTYNVSAMITLTGIGSGITAGTPYGSGGGATVNSPYYLL